MFYLPARDPRGHLAGFFFQHGGTSDVLLQIKGAICKNLTF